MEYAVLGYWNMESGGRNHFYVLCHMLPKNTRGVATEKKRQQTGLDF